ncbi:hypothetical protein ACWDX8_27265 [Streptomyces anthocyanicus]
MGRPQYDLARSIDDRVLVISEPRHPDANDRAYDWPQRPSA